LADVVLHQLGNDFIFLDQFGFELLDAAVFGQFQAAIAGGAFEGPFGLGQNLVDPEMDQTGLDLQFLGQLRNRLLVGEMATDDLGLLFRGEETGCTSAFDFLCR
jgi:hypothetical protein